jgi:hypothetical protein
MNIKKYVIIAGTVATMLVGFSSVVFAQDASMTPAPMMSVSGNQQMVLEVGPKGNVLLRGVVDSVGLERVNSNSIIVKSWGGSWIINISSDTKLMPGTDLSQFKVGDFVGVQGMVSQNSAWTIDATLVRNWNVRADLKAEVKANKDEVKAMVKMIKPRNWEGKASNITSASFILTVDSVAYTVNVASDAKVVNQKFLTMNFTDIKEGNTVRVYGPATDTTISASVVRDVSVGVNASVQIKQ